MVVSCRWIVVRAAAWQRGWPARRVLMSVIWWLGRSGSNRQPPEPKSGALPIAPRPSVLVLGALRGPFSSPVRGAWRWLGTRWLLGLFELHGYAGADGARASQAGAGDRYASGFLLWQVGLRWNMGSDLRPRFFVDGVAVGLRCACSIDGEFVD